MYSCVSDQLIFLVAGGGETVFEEEEEEDERDALAEEVGAN